ncbi:MAG: hypothetical protein ACE5IJ_03350 [Thermoplasmata archaeon]
MKRDLAVLQSLYAAGKPVSFIADTLQRTPAAVRLQASRLGVSRENGSDEEAHAIIADVATLLSGELSSPATGFGGRLTASIEALVRKREDQAERCPTCGGQMADVWCPTCWEDAQPDPDVSQEGQENAQEAVSRVSRIAVPIEEGATKDARLVSEKLPKTHVPQERRPVCASCGKTLDGPYRISAARGETYCLNDTCWEAGA